LSFESLPHGAGRKFIYGGGKIGRQYVVDLNPKRRKRSKRGGNFAEKGNDIEYEGGKIALSSQEGSQN